VAAAEDRAMSVGAPTPLGRTERLWAAPLAAILVNLPRGSVYSLGVLLRPIKPASLI